MSEDTVAKLTQQVEAVQAENAALTDELAKQTASNNNMLKAVVLCQGIVAQFFKPEVQKCFLQGKFNIEPYNEETLKSLTMLAEMLLPMPRVPRGKKSDENVMRFLTKLLSRSDEEVTDSQGVNLPQRGSYAWWRRYIHQISESIFWNELVKNDFSGFTLGEALVGKLNAGDGGASNARSTAANFASNDFGGALNTETPVRPKREVFGSGDVHARKDYYSDESSVESEAGHSTSSKIKKDQSSLEELFARLSRPKEAVPPGIFDGTEGASMKSFLDRYERYFDMKHDGNDLDRAVGLENFLQDQQSMHIRPWAVHS